MRSAATFALVLLAAGPAHAGGHPLDQLEPGHWYAAPDSSLSAVLPEPQPPGNPGSITGAWSGAAYDTARNRLVVWGGGHADYSGNELYAFDVPTMTWSRLTEPTLPVPDDGTHDAYPDGRPGSRHTYSGLAYLPAPFDRFFSAGGSLWRGGQCGGDTWVYDFDADVPEDGWTRLAQDDLGCGAIVEFDAEAGVVWAQHNWELERFDPQTETWSVGVRDLYWNTLNTNGVFDATRRAFVMVGTDESPRTFVYDMSDPESITGELLATDGAVEIELANAAGLSHDAMADRIVAWSGEPDMGLDPATVYLLELETATWTAQAPAATNTVVPSEAIAAGTWGRFRYVPDYNVHVLVNRIDDPVMFYRVAEGAGPGPDPDPDPQGTGSGGTGSDDATSSGGTSSGSDGDVPGSPAESSAAASADSGTQGPAGEEPDANGCACATTVTTNPRIAALLCGVLALFRRRRFSRANGVGASATSRAVIGPVLGKSPTRIAPPGRACAAARDRHVAPG